VPVLVADALPPPGIATTIEKAGAELACGCALHGQEGDEAPAGEDSYVRLGPPELRLC
jgi:hypothetical protein